MSKKKHITQYLHYYLGLSASPEFAILLRGQWGSGKTWFLKNYLEHHDTEHLYVSLNGVASFSEIQDQFFAQLHPLLASKPMKFASKLIKGLIKTTVQIDLDGNGKSDASLGSSIPDINLPDFLSKIDNKVLVFDDPERCSMPIPNILGYTLLIYLSERKKALSCKSSKEFACQLNQIAERTLDRQL
ncbi:P-loop NTPase fold protein [Dyadobacter sp. 22481]|uniref:P-loop NTPase fold protein n=1 Tax=Dyadobacter sp. 22481 TaxID=3453926 RepID=UPI003F829D0C